MTKKLYTESDIEDIADAIRAKNGSSDTYKVSEMATAIENISTGGFEVPADVCLAYSKCSTFPQSMTFATRTSCDFLFSSCPILTTAPLFDTSSVTSMSYMFISDSSLTTVPLYDTSSVTSVEYMFYGCTKLTTVPQFNLSSVTSVANMFYGCTKLTTVPQFNLSSVTRYMINMVYGCTLLSDTSLQNILKSLISATSYTSTKTLKNIGLTSAQATTCIGFTEWVTLSESGWTTGY